MNDPAPLPGTTAVDRPAGDSGEEHCPRCGAIASPALRDCVSCSADLGAPNVRAVRRPEELAALDRRYDLARTAASSQGVVAEFDSFVGAVQSRSHVVLAIDTHFARKLFSDSRALYVPYDRQVRSAVRLPAGSGNDTTRTMVGAALFGSYADQIIYGVLSIGFAGLPTYGPVFIGLRDVAVQYRVSFLEENSYRFFDRHKITTKGGVPRGYKGAWESRGRLAGAKYATKITAGQTDAVWPVLLVCPGASRDEDEFIEAHIHGVFNGEAVASIGACRASLSRDERRDLEVLAEVVEGKHTIVDLV